MKASVMLPPGIHDIRAETYHADPCQAPSLSSGIAKLMVRRSPLHAWHAHPRLNPNHEPMIASRPMNDGSILHGMILGKGGQFKSIAADDWRTKAAQSARDDAVAAGLVPVLAHKLDDLKECAKVATEQMRERPDCAEFFEEGQSEAVGIWREDASWCRMMVDRMPTGKRKPWFDIKCTGKSGAPADVQQAIIRDHAFQEAFYTRGGNALGLAPREMRFVVVEWNAPYAVSVMAAGATLRAVADAEVAKAIALWQRCERAAKWPGYTGMTGYVEAPPWVMQRLFDEELNDEIEAENAA